MLKNRSILLLTACLCITSFGCKGTQLRNLLTRSDYESLEDPNKTDREADTSERPGSLVSQEREVSPEAEDKAPKSKRRGFFNISGLFGRGDDDDIGSDPFVETVEDDELKTADVKSLADDDDKVMPIAGNTARDVIEKAAKSEDKAESLFREVAGIDRDSSVSERVNKDLPTKDTARSLIPEITPATDKDQSNQRSFADFLAEKSAQVKNATDEVAQPLFKEQDTAREELADTATKSVGGFDELLGTAENSSEVSESLSPSELFPALDKLIADDANTNSSSESGPTDDAVSPFDRLVDGTDADAPETPQLANNNPSQEAIGSSFADAKREHGFGETKTNSDPWSAFRNSQSSPATNSEGTGFAWEDDVADSRKVAETQRPAVTRSPLDRTDSPFAPVSSSFELSAVDTDLPHRNESAGFEEPPTFEEPLFIPDAEAAATERELFSDAQPVSELDPFNELVAEAAGPVPVDAEAEPAETAAGFTFSTRTWFLLFGVVIVGLLLFMPERQNRSNA